MDSVKGNQLGDAGHRILGQALLEATSSKLAFIQCDQFSLGQSDKELNLQGKNLTALDAILLGGVLKANTTLKSIKCASHYSLANPSCAANGILHMALLGPVNAALSLLLSLTNNQLCGIDEDGDGAYTAEGIVQISEALKVNQTLQSIKSAAESSQSTFHPRRCHGPLTPIIHCIDCVAVFQTILFDLKAPRSLPRC